MYFIYVVYGVLTSRIYGTDHRLAFLLLDLFDCKVLFYRERPAFTSAKQYGEFLESALVAYLL